MNRLISNLLLFVSVIPMEVNPDLLYELQQSKSILCNQGYPTIVHYGSQLSQASESILNRFLIESNDSVTIITNTTVYTVPHASCMVLFLDTFGFVGSVLNYVEYLSRTAQMKLVVTTAIGFHILKNIFHETLIYSVIYFVHSESQYAICHPNVLLDSMKCWTELRFNPVMEAARDMGRKEIFTTHMSSNQVVMRLFELFASDVNGTMARQMSIARTGLWVNYGSFRHQSLVVQQVYSNQLVYYNALVPRIGKALPMIAILFDPFDAMTWVTYALMIFSISLFRLWCSQRQTWKEFIKSLQEIFASVVLGTPVMFHRTLEQATTGLFMLLNVVLIAAYESLVISFLLNPRFYPEIDTVQQINELCCWGGWNSYGSIVLPDLNICFSIRNLNETFSVKHDKWFVCYMVEPRYEMYWQEIYSNPTIAQHYRMSKAEVEPHPAVAFVFGDIGLGMLLQKYMSAFFGEGALNMFHERQEQASSNLEKAPVAVAVEDLLLLWLSFLGGTIVCISVFLGELVMGYAAKRKLNSQRLFIYVNGILVDTNH